MILIPSEFVHELLEEINPLIEKVISRQQRGYDLRDILEAIARNEFQVWVDQLPIRLLVITKITKKPKLKECWISLASGAMPENWPEHSKQIEQWAKSQGCDEMAEAGRFGWERKLKSDGWEKSQTILRKTL